MNIDLLLLQIIAHLLADFIFQPHKWTVKKKKYIFHYLYFMHILVVILFSYLLSLQKNFWIFSIIIGITHLFIDIIKTWLSQKIKDFDFFFVDQLCHIVVIVISVYFYTKFYDITFCINTNTKFLAAVAGFIFCYTPANIFIKHILNICKIEIPEENQDKNDLPKAGKVIGITERFIVLILIITGQISIIGFVLASKSILRINDIKKGEYVLVGTLLSFAFAIFTGILINYISNI